MLVRSRKNDESVVVGSVDGFQGAVKVKVLEIGSGIAQRERGKCFPEWDREEARTPSGTRYDESEVTD